MSQTLISVLDFNVTPDGKSLSTEGIQAAITAASEQGGGHVVVPAGTYLTGPLEMCSNLTFEIQAGATLLFSDDQKIFPTIDSRWEGVKKATYMHCIYGKNLKNFTLTGEGTLDGQGQQWWDYQINDKPKILFPRPYLIGIDYSENITLSNLTLINSPSWTVHPMECFNVNIDNLSILNPADSPNTDGIDPESCKDVRITNCHIDVGDDCIAIKAGTEETTSHKSPCENITISNCNMVHGHGGVVIGSEMSGNVRNVTITNCVFQETDRGIRMKTRRGRGGIIENITVSNIVMEDVICPFVINAYYFCGPKGKEKYVWDKSAYPITEETPLFRDIQFNNIIAKNVNAAAGFIYGLPEMNVTGISFSNIHVEMKEHGKPGRPAMMSGIEDMHNSGFFLGNVDTILFNNFILENIEGPAFKEEAAKNVIKSQCYIKKENTLNGL